MLPQLPEVVEVEEVVTQDLLNHQEKIDFLLRKERGTLTKSHVRVSVFTELIKTLPSDLLLAGVMLDHLLLPIVHQALQKVVVKRNFTIAEECSNTGVYFGA